MYVDVLYFMKKKNNKNFIKKRKNKINSNELSVKHDQY